MCQPMDRLYSSFRTNRYYCAVKSSTCEKVKFSLAPVRLQAILRVLAKLENVTDRILRKYQEKIHSYLISDKNTGRYTSRPL